MSSRARQGFTLLELVVVLAVIAVLGGVVAPMVFRHVADARQVAATSQEQVFELALDAYRLDNGQYPPSGAGLEALVTNPGSAVAPNWRGPYLKRGLPKDPWGRGYLYRSPTPAGAPDTYLIESLGRDGQPGGAGEDADVKTGPGVR